MHGSVPSTLAQRNLIDAKLSETKSQVLREKFIHYLANGIWVLVPENAFTAIDSHWEELNLPFSIATIQSFIDSIVAIPDDSPEV